MSKLGDTVIKFLNDKKKQRWVIEAADLFNLLNSMGILDDVDSMFIVIEDLENSDIDVNFRDTDIEYYKIFKAFEKQYKFFKSLKYNRADVVKMINKVDEIEVKLDDDWLQLYKNDDEAETTETTTTGQLNPDLLKLNEKIKNEITDRIIQNLNQVSDEERMQLAMEQINELNNIINNN